MNEQWNKALDQVEDSYLQEAASYRRKRHWPRVAAAAAAALVLVIGWSVLHPEQTSAPSTSPNEGTAVTTVAPSGNSGSPNAEPPDKGNFSNGNSQWIPHKNPSGEASGSNDRIPHAAPNEAAPNSSAEAAPSSSSVSILEVLLDGILTAVCDFWNSFRSSIENLFSGIKP